MIKIRLAAAAAVLILAAECTGCAAAQPAQSTPKSTEQGALHHGDRRDHGKHYADRPGIRHAGFPSALPVLGI